MQLTYPIGLLGLALAVPIVALHLRRQPSQRVQVSSLIFWERMRTTGDGSSAWGSAGSWHLPLLILQLACLLALVVALVRPVFRPAATPPAATSAPLDRRPQLTRLAARRMLQDSAQLELLVQIENPTTESHSCSLRLRADDQVMDVVRVDVPPGERTSLIRRFEFPTAADWHADLDGVEDVAGVRVESAAPIPVALIGEADAALARALRSAGRVDLQTFPEPPGDLSPDTLVVLHQCAPPRSMTYNTLIVDPPAADATEPPLVATEVAAQRPESSWLDAVQLVGLDFAGARPLERPDGFVSLAWNAKQEPLIAVDVQPTHWTIVLNVHLSESDLPRDVAFPLFVRNVVATHAFGIEWRDHLGGFVSSTAPPVAAERDRGSRAGTIAGLIAFVGLVIEWAWATRRRAE